MARGGERTADVEPMLGGVGKEGTGGIGSTSMLSETERVVPFIGTKARIGELDGWYVTLLLL